MSQQQFPLEQDTAPRLIYVQYANGEIVPYLVEEHYDQQPWFPAHQPSYPYEGVYLDTGDFQYYPPYQDNDFGSVTDYQQAHHQPPAAPSPDPPPCFSIQIPGYYDSSAELLPASPSGTSVSSSSSASTVRPDVCNQAQPHFDKETQRWYCGGCNKIFSDKYGTERHIATVGRKVTCRYCGRQISALESSRRRHFQRDSCRKRSIERGFTSRKEEDAFIEQP